MKNTYQNKNNFPVTRKLISTRNYSLFQEKFSFSEIIFLNQDKFLVEKNLPTCYLIKKIFLNKFWGICSVDYATYLWHSSSVHVVWNFDWRPSVTISFLNTLDCVMEVSSKNPRVPLHSWIRWRIYHTGLRYTASHLSNLEELPNSPGWGSLYINLYGEPCISGYYFKPKSLNRVQKLTKNSGYDDCLLKNNRLLFSLLFCDLKIPKQVIEMQNFFLNRLSRFLKNGHLPIMLYLSAPPPPPPMLF